MFVTIIAQHRCIVNINAIVLLTLYQKYYGEKFLYQRSTYADAASHTQCPEAYFLASGQSCLMIGIIETAGECGGESGADGYRISANTSRTPSIPKLTAVNTRKYLPVCAPSDFR